MNLTPVRFDTNYGLVVVLFARPPHSADVVGWNPVWSLHVEIAIQLSIK